MNAMILQSLLPVLLVIALGAALRHGGFLPPLFFVGLNKLVFWVGLPCLLFGEIAAARVSGGETLRVSALLVVVTLALLPCAWLAARLLRLPPPSRRAFLQGSYRGNLAYVGLPVVVYALAHDAGARAVATLAMAPTIPFFNVLSVLVLLPPGSGGRSRGAWRALAEIARNPLILSCLLGLAAMATGVRLPLPLARAVEAVGRIGLPGALLALGGGLTFQGLRGRAGPALAATLLKVALSPLLGLLIAQALGLRGDLRTVALLYAATPTAVASYVMAEQMGADEQLAAAIIVLSTLAAFPAMALTLIACGA